eukprot:2414780-Amphidinium_carterae.1
MVCCNSTRLKHTKHQLVGTCVDHVHGLASPHHGLGLSSGDMGYRGPSRPMPARWGLHTPVESVSNPEEVPKPKTPQSFALRPDLVEKSCSSPPARRVPNHSRRVAESARKSCVR